MTCRGSLAALWLLLLASFCRGDFVEVRRAATIKDAPSGEATTLSRPAVGDLLQLEPIADTPTDQRNGYYLVYLEDGSGTGWIYRTLVRRHCGDAPGWSPATNSTGLLADDPGVIDVMWWNIRDFSSASRDDGELKLIAQVIRPAEVCAIGELNEPTVLFRLAAVLGPEWSLAYSPKVGDSPSSAEHYGFLWDSTALRLVGDVQVDHASEATIDREPAWATFETTDEQLDFTLIAVHVTWGHLVSERKAEICQLPDVWHRVQLDTPDDDDLILVGDFNRNIGDDSFDGLFEIPGMVRANEESPATHVSSTSTYDQVFLSTAQTDEWTPGQFELHRFDETVFGGDDERAKLAGSDHRPVLIRLSSN